MTTARLHGAISFSANAIPLCLLAAVLLGCQPGREYRTQLLPMSQLRVPEENQHYRELAWLASDLLIVNYDTSTPVPVHINRLGIDYDYVGTRDDLYQLGTHHPAQNGLVPINVPADPDPQCLRSEFSDPIRLPDGRLGFVRSCWLLNYDWRVFLMAWDPNTSDTRPLFPYTIPWEGKYITATYAPDLSRGVAGDLVHIEDHLHWLERDGVHPLDVGMVRADRPQWSPDGQWIAFTGNKTMQGNPGPNWAAQLYDLWLMPANCGHEGKPCAESLRRLLQGIEPNGMKWSPDSKRIAFGGYPSGHSNGIWILDVGTGNLTQIATGDYSMPAWSPDGRQIAVVGPEVADNPNDPNSPTHPKTLYVIDISALK